MITETYELESSQESFDDIVFSEDLTKFIDNYGDDAANLYQFYANLVEEYGEDAVSTFIDYHGVEKIFHFEDCFLGEYDDFLDYVEEHFYEEHFGELMDLSENLQESISINFDNVAKSLNSKGFKYINGFVFGPFD